MKFGAQINSFEAGWEAISAYIAALEGGRWNSLWIADHFLPPIGDRDEGKNCFEAFTLLSVAAGMTRRVELGTLVLGISAYIAGGRALERNPALVAKMAATLDQASRGRLVLGIGAAWFGREHAAYGWDFPAMRERSDRLEEACKLIRTLFTAHGPVDFQGRYYRVEQAPLMPGCCRKPHIPILVGGVGERRTLRTLARYGDVFNLNGWELEMSLAAYRRKAEVIERHCAAVGRDPAEIHPHAAYRSTCRCSLPAPATGRPRATRSGGSVRD